MSNQQVCLARKSATETLIDFSSAIAMPRQTYQVSGPHKTHLLDTCAKDNVLLPHRFRVYGAVGKSCVSIPGQVGYSNVMSHPQLRAPARMNARH